MQVTLPKLIDLFATTKQIEGKSERTITWYRSFLTKFAEFVGNGAPGHVFVISCHDAD
jgi:hypothetical protein